MPKEKTQEKQPVNAIGVISTGFEANVIIHNPYVSSVLSGILATAGESECNVSLYTTAWSTRSGSQRWFSPTPVDGIIVLAPSVHTDLIAALCDLGLPTVATSADALDFGIPTVDTDDVRGATLATEHLISLGHKRIAHLAGTMSQADAFNRRDTFFNVMTAAGLTVEPEFVVETGFDAVNAYSDATRLLTGDRRPTAIFAATDYIAYWTIQAARDLGIDVPAQLSVVGYDDSPIARESLPRITTVRQPLVEMGQFAASLLFQQMASGNVEPKTHKLPAELIVRETTARPPA